MRLILCSAALLAAWIFSSVARGMEVRSGEDFVLAAEETIHDDLYVFGRKITIDGTIEGDLIAFGEQITINGVVNGDVIAAAQTVVLQGSSQDARIAGQVLKLSPAAKVEGDVVAAGYSLETEKESTVTGDVAYAGFQALLAGNIECDLVGGLVNGQLAGTIGGDVILDVGGQTGQAPPPMYGPPPPVPFPNVPGGLTVADTASVQGELTYQAAEPAQVDPRASLNGEVTHTAPPPQQAAPAQKTWTQLALDRLRHAACVAIVGLLAVVMLPQWSNEWAGAVRHRPVLSFFGGVLGLLGFVALLVLLLVTIVAAAVVLGLVTLQELVPMVVVGGLVSWAAIVVVFWLLAAFLSEAIAALALGSLGVDGDNFALRLVALLLGLAVIALLVSIPYAGPWIGLIVFLFGFGGFCLWLVGLSGEEGERVYARDVKA